MFHNIYVKQNFSAKDLNKQKGIPIRTTGGGREEEIKIHRYIDL